jgi:hypothetical protein
MMACLQHRRQQPTTIDLVYVFGQIPQPHRAALPCKIGLGLPVRLWYELGHNRPISSYFWRARTLARAGLAPI